MKCTFWEFFINNMKEGDKNTGTERMWQQKSRSGRPFQVLCKRLKLI